MVWPLRETTIIIMHKSRDSMNIEMANFEWNCRVNVILAYRTREYTYINTTDTAESHLLLLINRKIGAIFI